MQLAIFILSGLFLGWSLGANDAANIFGTAVGTRMIKFKTAAVIASLFVIIGAIVQGSGGTETLSQLGSVNALGGAFAVALCAAIIVTIMTMYKLPVSTSQAIVGAIMGWCFFTSSPIDYSVLGMIAGSWVSSPILGAIFAAIFYKLMRKFLRNTRIHVIKLDRFIKYGLLLTGAFGAYGLGANNIANVMGVFVNSIDLQINIGSFSITSVQLLFLLGGISIAVGIFTYSKKVMETVGNGILVLTPETAIVVVFSQALVLFLFSSQSFSNFLHNLGLPAIPLVPVSSTQVVVGAVMGIGLVRGIQEVKFKTLGNIAIGWVLTPILAGILTFFSLFFLHNVFNVQIAQEKNTAISNTTIDNTTIINIPADYYNLLLIIFSILLLFLLLYIVLYYRSSKIKLIQQEKNWTEQIQYIDFQKALSEMEVKNIELENNLLITRLEEKRKELITYALSIGEQRQFLESINQTISELLTETDEQTRHHKLSEVNKVIKQKMSFSDEIEELYLRAEKVHQDFPTKLSMFHPNLTDQEKKLTLLLRIGFSSKEIAPLLNISPKSVEISRYRLRKKLNLQKDDNLTQYIKTM